MTFALVAAGRMLMQCEPKNTNHTGHGEHWEIPQRMVMGSRMKNWAGLALVIAAVLMMAVSGQLGLLMIVLPGAAVFAYATTRMAGRAGRHRI
jgi:hypothetical protein